MLKLYLSRFVKDVLMMNDTLLSIWDSSGIIVDFSNFPREMHFPIAHTKAFPMLYFSSSSLAGNATVTASDINIPKDEHISVFFSYSWSLDGYFAAMVVKIYCVVNEPWFERSEKI